jgi:adenosylcobinamide-GDP ribazoletransferase
LRIRTLRMVERQPLKLRIVSLFHWYVFCLKRALYFLSLSWAYGWVLARIEAARVQIPQLRVLPAIQFLSIVPVKRGFTMEEVGHSAAFFPVVGLIIGLALVVLNYFLGMFLPFSVDNVLLLVALVIITGAMHMDGLVDTCDGVAGHRTVEERLNIMRDSRVGGFGAIGGALILLVKFVVLNSVPRDWIGSALILMPVLSRWAMVYSIYAYPSARPDGLGKMFKDGVGWIQMAAATLIAVLVALVLFHKVWFSILLFVFVLATATALFLKNRLKGLTGDTYGAINEIAEVGVLIMISLLAYKQWL